MASSSSVMSCINSALDVVESYHIFDKDRLRLGNLKIFVLLAGKCGTDVHLGSLLLTIEDIVTRISQILPNSLGSEDSGGVDEVLDRAERFAFDFQRDFESLKEGVDEWYIATSDNTGRSNSLTADEVGEISESILENLVDLPRRFSRVLLEVMEPLREHMNFLKNLCRFATSRGVDHRQMKDFLAHTESVAISAAHLCFLCGDDIEDEEWLTGMQSKLSMLVQKIKPVDPQVCETYYDEIPGDQKASS